MTEKIWNPTFPVDSHSPYRVKSGISVYTLYDITNYDAKYTIFVSYDFITHIHANIGDFHEYIQIRTTRETGRND